MVFGGIAGILGDVADLQLDRMVGESTCIDVIRCKSEMSVSVLTREDTVTARPAAVRRCRTNCVYLSKASGEPVAKVCVCGTEELGRLNNFGVQDRIRIDYGICRAVDVPG